MYIHVCASHYIPNAILNQCGNHFCVSTAQLFEPSASACVFSQVCGTGISAQAAIAAASMCFLKQSRQCVPKIAAQDVGSAQIIIAPTTFPLFPSANQPVCTSFMGSHIHLSSHSLFFKAYKNCKEQDYVRTSKMK